MSVSAVLTPRALLGSSGNVFSLFICFQIHIFQMLMETKSFKNLE